MNIWQRSSAIAIAASIMLCVGIAVYFVDYFYFENPNEHHEDRITQKQDFAKNSAQAQSHTIAPAPASASASQSNDTTEDDTQKKLMELDTWIKSGSHLNLLKAVDEINDCVSSESLRRLNPDLPPAEKFCAQIDPTYIRQRQQWVDAAIAAKTLGAGASYWRMGHNGNIGDLYSRPDDLSVKNWENRVVEVERDEAMRGNIDALANLAAIYSRAGIPALADVANSYAYKKAQLTLEDNANSKGWLDQLNIQIAKLPQEQQTIINSQAQLLVNTIKGNKK
jgi:hypothetical protein